VRASTPGSSAWLRASLTASHLVAQFAGRDQGPSSSSRFQAAEATAHMVEGAEEPQRLMSGYSVHCFDQS
jgi:hypothetical protein